MASVQVLPSPVPASTPRKRRRLHATSDVLLHEATVSSQKTVFGDAQLENEDENSSSESENTIECAECGVQFKHATELAAHGQKTRHRPFSCEYEGCGKRYTKREHLTRHVETVHVRGALESLNERKPFKCELCDARFTYNHGLTRHTKRSHRNVNLPFECLKCLKGFKKKSELQAHSYVHTGILPFKCEECGERFLKRFWLTRHQRKHDASREADTQAYMCDCGEICFDKEELRNHKQTEHCDKEEKDNAEDRDMEASALVCLVCDQRFCRKQYLRAHLRTHFVSLDERKQYVCPIEGCEKAYTCSSNLMAHYNAVHDERKSKRFACPREGCTARFGYKTVLKHHLESIHDHPKPPKRRKRKSIGILTRALGVNQVGSKILQVAAEEENNDKAT